MRKKMTIIGGVVIAILFILSLWRLREISLKNQRDHMIDPVHVETDLERIKREGKVKVVVANNSIDYFSYKGRMMGLKYEILNQFCEDLGVELVLYVEDDFSTISDGLNRREYDFAAQDITITKARKNSVEYTIPLATSEQVLIQRIPEDWELLSTDMLDSLIVREQLELGGKTIHIPKNINYASRLIALSDEIGDTIYVEQDSIANEESLIAEVANGEIDYTVAYRDVAEVNKRYYSNIDAGVLISFKQDRAWIVRKGNVQLRDYLNDWLLGYMQTASYRVLHSKYYNQRRDYISPTNLYTTLQGGQLSEFDKLIKSKSERFGVDWRLVASIIFTESSFDPQAKSWVGAHGLMQVMPDAAKTFKVDDYNDPNGNLEAGLRLLTWLDQVFLEEIPDPEDRMKFVLASYNVGLGHVRDAQRLAEKYGKITIVWDDNVDYYLRNKSKAEFLNDPLVKYGSCRGEEPYQYVIKVLDTYHHYCNLIPSQN